MKENLFDFEPLEEGILIKRYKRFLADVRLKNGRIVTAHCPNTGPMKGLINHDSKVRLSYSPSPKRKLSWTWEQVQVLGKDNEKTWVGVNTLFANKLIKKVIEKNLLYEYLGEIENIRSEVAYGQNNKSRIDILLIPKTSDNDNRKIYIEVKNTTWVKEGIALFPDTVTLRGQKHLNELISISPECRSILIPCITRKDVSYFTSGDEADPEYGNLFRQSIQKGIEILPCCFSFHSTNIRWEGMRPLLNKTLL